MLSHNNRHHPLGSVLQVVGSLDNSTKDFADNWWKGIALAGTEAVDGMDIAAVVERDIEAVVERDREAVVEEV